MAHCIKKLTVVGDTTVAWLVEIVVVAWLVVVVARLVVVVA